MTATNPVFINSNLAYAVGRHVVITVPINITAGVPTFKGEEKPEILIEKGLAGSQVILAQANIDALLGSTNEFVEAGIFGTTAMAADNTLAFVLDCDGQIDRVDLVECQVDMSSTGAIPGLGFGTKTVLTDAAFTNPEVQVSAAGNIACRVLYTNISATGTAGIAFVKLHALLK